ncbi:GNAT family N-acetyltransferase [Wukongibacter baidiensis]|uniref:GNAT family N-acetyltransferase n=1 Tax=Wukongibacter baidiensis TaxID=1723361 RepID=UPI003D7FA49D
MDKITVREFTYTLEDAKKLKEIDSVTFKDCNYEERKIIEISKNPQNKIFIAEYDDLSVGFISLIEVQTLHYHGLWVDLIAVKPEFQKLGVGQKLLEYGQRYGKELKVDMMSALVATNNHASKRSFEKREFLSVDKEYNLYLYEQE